MHVRFISSYTSSRLTICSSVVLKAVVFAAVLTMTMAGNAIGVVNIMDKVTPVLSERGVEIKGFNLKSPLKVTDNYFGIPRENIQSQFSFVGNNGDNAVYEVIFAYSNNISHPGTNFFNEFYIVPDYLDSRKGEGAYRVSNIVMIKELSGEQSIGFLANGVRRDNQGFVSVDIALVVPDDQTFAFSMLRTLANDPKAPFGLQCLNSKRFFDNKNILSFARKDVPGKGIHFVKEQWNR